ncbi:hypothetical protein Cst_c15950 [Thermoclostridium stercorarium subsp. stercorarium DSM 8532]|uniref:Uncharacterized protein n=1 Tax=Thermoclostridium stercorarium (strain ATCC 35414 / DSM 8532 / NCIMB 11754) TaxID=1121335 RepID=L7VQ82_THES1|nr:hypothetical protein Cst_c15950 [Thermoclostridium stercorarium subsp. stercorarium DSM 8532]
MRTKDDFEDAYNTIKYENFRKLMDICFELASYFSFSKAP